MCNFRQNSLHPSSLFPSVWGASLPLDTNSVRVEEMAPQLGALDALPEEPGLSSNTNLAIHSHL